MVGEIRDHETAQTAVEASLTGHLVLSTLHTNSAPETGDRLLDMGMDPFNFADSLLAVLAQRSVRRLCGECRTSRPQRGDRRTAGRPPERLRRRATPALREATLRGWIERFGRDGRLQHFHAPGCALLGINTGFRGRAGRAADGGVARAVPPHPDRRPRRGPTEPRCAKAVPCARTASRRSGPATTTDEVRAISNS